MNSNTKISDKAMKVTGWSILFIIYTGVGHLAFETDNIFLCIVWMVGAPTFLWWLDNRDENEN